MTFLTNRLSLLFVIYSFPLYSMAQNNNCPEVPQQELMSFFSNQNEWTEVESKDSNQIAKNPAIRIKVNFNQITQSTVVMGKKRFGKVDQICQVSATELKIIAGNNKIRISKISGNRILSHMKVFGKDYTYFYLPTHLVDGADQLSQLDFDVAEDVEIL